MYRLSNLDRRCCTREGDVRTEDMTAESIFNESIESMEPVLGNKHPHVLHAKHYLAWLGRCQERFDIAVELFNEVLI